MYVYMYVCMYVYVGIYVHLYMHDFVYNDSLPFGGRYFVLTLNFAIYIRNLLNVPLEDIGGFYHIFSGSATDEYITKKL